MNVFGRKFNYPPASPAYHVIVRFLAEIVLVVGLLYVEAHLLEDATVDEKRERAIDGSQY